MKKLFLVAIILLLACALFLASGQDAQAAVKYQLTATGTQGTPGTPTMTATPSATPMPTPTTTLEPLPAITLIFPVYTATATATSTPRVLTVTATPEPTDAAAVTSFTPRLVALAIFVLVIWIFLAIFAIVYIRQFR